MHSNMIEAVMGAIVLIIASFFLIFAYTSSKGGVYTGYPLVANFDRVDGLAVGNDVRISGIKVGSVLSIEIDPKIAKIGRDSLVEELKERNIGTSLHFIPIFEHPYYKKTHGFQRKDYPNACQMYDRSVSLPLFAGMTKTDEKDVIDAMKELLS